jgi:predicted nucleic acid-binding protein
VLITSKIRFINQGLIPKEIYKKAEVLTSDIDIDDTEFVALAEHIKAKFWSGDKVLKDGLMKMGWNKFITTDELYNIITKR